MIAGAGKREAEYKARKVELGLDNVHFVGAVDDTDKMALMQLCTALVLSSNKSVPRPLGCRLQKPP